MNPDLLDLRQPEDLDAILRMLMTLLATGALHRLAAGGEPETRDRLEKHSEHLASAVWGKSSRGKSRTRRLLHGNEWMNETSAEAPSVPAPGKTGKRSSPEGLGDKKKKRWLKILMVLVIVVAMVAGCVSNATKNANDPTQQQLSGVHRHPTGSDGQRHRHRHAAAGGFLQRHHPALRRYRQRSL